jgi:hypothetical protein
MQIVDHLEVIASPNSGAQVQMAFIRESTATSARRDGARVFLGDGIRRLSYRNVISSTARTGEDGQEVTLEPVLLNVGEDSAELAEDLQAAGWRQV